MKPKVRIVHHSPLSKCDCFAFLEFRDNVEPLKIILLQSMFRYDADLVEYRRLRDLGYRFVLIQSYQQFPSTIENPYDYDYCQRAFRTAFPDLYYEDLIGACVCSRTAATDFAGAPNMQPTLTLSESDIPPQLFLDRAPTSPPPLYDFVYSCNVGDWSGACRNYKQAQTMIRRMVVDYGLRVFICGRVGAQLESLENLAGVSSAAFMPQHEFIDVVSRSRALFVPNVSDASPRVISEALCMNRPVLINRRIYGGWKYFEGDGGASMGRTFDGLATFDMSLRDFLQVRDTLQPRDAFMARYAYKSADALYDYLCQQWQRAEASAGTWTLRHAKSTVVVPVTHKAVETAMTMSLIENDLAPSASKHANNNRRTTCVVVVLVVSIVLLAGILLSILMFFH